MKKNKVIALRFMDKRGTYEEAFYYGLVIHWVAIVSAVSKKVLVEPLEYADTAWEQREKLEER